MSRLLLSLLALLSVQGWARPPSPVVMPPQDIPIHFSHATHIKTGLECDWCHEEAEESVKTADLLLPKEETCLECHDPEDKEMPATRCQDCHVGFVGSQRDGGAKPRPWSFPPARLHFAHRSHAAAGVECETCHQDMEKVGLATVEQLPRERDCVACHEKRGVSTRCATCHLSGPDGRLRTEFGASSAGSAAPEEQSPAMRGSAPLRLSAPLWAERLVPRGARGARHDENWNLEHGPAAQADPTLCSSCHRDSECRDCHGGVMRPLRAHPDDWVLTHPLAARSSSLRCQSCHRQQTFCRDCHRQARVVNGSEDMALRFPPQQQFHPPGWASFDGLSPDHHGVHARRNIATCASCHSEKTCLSCHATLSTIGMGVSPHPSGFEDRCESLLLVNPTPCAKCHGDGFRCP